jgi:polysaccharide export outer membrane protein
MLGAPQTAGSGTVPQPPAAAASAVYRLGPDDVLTIKVLNFDNLSSNVVVPPDGNIVLPLLDSIRVTGMSLDELKQTLVDKWRKFVINPAVFVALQTKRKEDVLFYGFVSRVGTVEYRPDLRLVEALAQAGGATPDGDLGTLTLTHKDGTRQVLDLTHPESKGGTAADIPLQPADVVYVPERRQEISVLGEVAKPGSMPYKEDMTVLDALTEAGNVRADTADLAASTLIHKGQETSLNLDAMLRRGDLTGNVKLSPGDRIMVPEIRNRVYVFGAVGSPGYYPYKIGDRVMDALKSAGGPGKDANLSKMNLIRMDRTKNTATLQHLNIEQAFKKAKMVDNIGLQPGDILYVPDSKHKFGIQDLFGISSGLSIITEMSYLLR